MRTARSQLTPQALETEIDRRWRQILELDGDGDGNLLSEDFFDLGGSSLQALQLLTGIEDELGFAVPLMAFALHPTKAGLLEALRPAEPQISVPGQVPAASVCPATSLVPMKPDGSRKPFFFIHAEFGHTLFAQGLARALDSEQPMYGLQSRGLDGSEEPFTKLPHMASYYIDLIKTIQPSGPYRLGGFCMGALLALEMTNQLQDRGEDVSHLAIFSTDASWINIHGFGDQVNYHRREMGNRSMLGKGRYLWARIRFRIYRCWSGLVCLLRKFLLPRGRSLSARLRYVFVAELNYRAGWDLPTKPYRGTISYFQGDGDSLRDPQPFWSPLAEGGIEIHRVRGELGLIFSPENVAGLAVELKQSLSRPAVATESS